MAHVPIQDEIAWSRDSAKYLPILGELSGLQKQIEQIPGAGVRTSSKLLPLVPAIQCSYAAIPNVGATVGEANRLFQERVNASPILKEWWAEQSQNGTDVNAMVQKIQTISGYLGDEIVMAVPATEDGSAGLPIILAEVKQPGLKEFLQGEIVSANAKAGKTVLQMVDDPRSLPATSSTTEHPAMNVYMANGMVAISPIRCAYRTCGSSSEEGRRGELQRLRYVLADSAGLPIGRRLAVLRRPSEDVAAWSKCTSGEASDREGQRI